MKMNNVTVVTSCSLVGWDKYGANFVDTFIKYWPNTVKLYVVSEDALPDCPADSYLPLAASLEAREFLDRYAGAAWVHGDASDPGRPLGKAKHWKPNAGNNCFRFDAYKFSKKVFAIALVAERLMLGASPGKLFWVDSDVTTFDHIPDSLFDITLPSDYALSALVRKGYHSECGYVGYNLEHSATIGFIRAFARLYYSDEVFDLYEWHDSYVFDWLRNKTMISTYSIPHKSKSHPFINSVLGKYMDHFKGKRKKQGHSYKQEQLVHKQLEYWKGK